MLPHQASATLQSLADGETRMGRYVLTGSQQFGLAGDCGISQLTARQWFTVLQASHLVALLAPYHRNFREKKAGEDARAVLPG